MDKLYKLREKFLFQQEVISVITAVTTKVCHETISTHTQDMNLNIQKFS